MGLDNGPDGLSVEALKMRSGRFLLAAIGLLVLAAGALGQNRSPVSTYDRHRFLVSAAQSGTTNIVDGDVTFKRSDAKWELLIAGDDLQDGNGIKTGADGRVEILLNPGAYLRIAENSHIEISKNPSQDLVINLLTGSAIVEVSLIEGWQGVMATVITPGGAVDIARGGIYRFNVKPSGESEALVYKGRLVLAGALVKEGSRAIIANSGASQIAAFDKAALDGFDLWSKDRAKVLIAANKRLSRRAILASSRTTSGWFYNPFSRCYTYLPYYSCVSPYGGRYATCWTNSNPTWGGGTGPIGTNSYNGWSTSSSDSVSRTSSSSSSSSSTITTMGPSTGGSSSGGWTSSSTGTVTRRP